MAKKKVKVRPKARPKKEPTPQQQKYDAILATRGQGRWTLPKGHWLLVNNFIHESQANEWLKPGDVVRLRQGAINSQHIDVEDDRIRDALDKHGQFHSYVFTPMTQEVEDLRTALGLPNELTAPLKPEPPPPPEPGELPEEVTKDTGVSYARGSTMVRILRHFNACQPPIQYAEGYPPDHPAAQVWEDVLLNRPNPKGQEVQAYWIRTMLQNVYGHGYGETLLNELPPEIRARRKTHGSDDLIVRQHMLAVMPWSRMEAEMVKKGNWKFTEAELAAPYNAAQPKEQYMPTNNQTQFLAHLIVHANRIAQKHGLQKIDEVHGFLENLEQIEEFIKLYGGKANVVFAQKDTIDARLAYIADLFRENGAQIGVEFQELVEETKAATLDHVTKEELLGLARKMETRLTTLEQTLAQLSAVLIENGFDGTDGE